MPSLKRAGVVGAMVVWLAALAPAPAAAQDPLVITQVKPDVYAAFGGLGGANGNSTIIIGRTSVIVVEPKQSEVGAKELLDAIAKITPKPVMTLIPTHITGIIHENAKAGHVTGLIGYSETAKLITHESGRKELAAAYAEGGHGVVPANRQPIAVTKNGEAMTIDGVQLVIYHWAPAHTEGDLTVYLPAQKVASTGDLILDNRADDNQVIHMDRNGSAAGWFANVKGMLSLDVETYVPGHGTLKTKAGLQQKLDATQARYDKVAAMIKEGKTLAEIKAALPDAPNPGAPARGANAAGRAGRAGGAAVGAAGAARGRGEPAPGWVDAAYADLTK